MYIKSRHEIGSEDAGMHKTTMHSVIKMFFNAMHNNIQHQKYSMKVRFLYLYSSFDY